jgi:hypothetical protein
MGKITKELQTKKEFEELLRKIFIRLDLDAKIYGGCYLDIEYDEIGLKQFRFVTEEIYSGEIKDGKNKK